MCQTIKNLLDHNINVSVPLYHVLILCHCRHHSRKRSYRTKNETGDSFPQTSIQYIGISNATRSLFFLSSFSIRKMFGG